MLPKENRLTKNQFQRLGKQGKKYRGDYGMLVVERQEEVVPKFGFVVSKKIGNAVQRHRMTRLLREISRKYIKDTSNMGVIYIAYKYCENYKELEKDTSQSFENAIRDFKTDRVKSN